MPTSRELDQERRAAQAAIFAAWLRAAMESSGYGTVGTRPGGRAQLAQDAKVSASNLSRWLSGENIPSVETLLRFAEILGADPIEGLRAGGFEDLAAWVVKVTGQKQPAPEPVLTRIERARGLDDAQRAYLAGFYMRRIEAARKEAAKEVADLIELLERRAESM